jgi:hypothetical protein
MFSKITAESCYIRRGLRKVKVVSLGEVEHGVCQKIMDKEIEKMRSENGPLRHSHVTGESA